jgi:large-conductance mechanosensitive channel
MIIAFWIIFILVYMIFNAYQEEREEQQLKKENQKKLDELVKKSDD